MTKEAAFRAVRHDDLSALGAVAPAGATATLFQTQPWLAAWWAAAKSMPDVEPFVVELRGEEPILLLPLCRRRDGWLRVIEFSDAGLSDTNAPILLARSSFDAMSFRAIWKAIVGVLPPHDLLRLEKMPERIAELPNPLAAGLAARCMHLRTWSAEIPPSWSHSPRPLWSRKFIATLRRRRRLLAAEQDGHVASLEGAERRLATCRAIMDMRRARVARSGRRDILERPGVAAFYERLVADDGLAIRSHVVGVFAAARLIGGCVGFIHAGRYHGILLGFDELYARYAPGNLAIAQVFDDCAAQGVPIVDFSLGDEDYKLSFGVRPSVLLEYHAARSMLGFVYIGAQAVKRRSRRIRDRLRGATGSVPDREPSRATTLADGVV